MKLKNGVDDKEVLPSNLDTVSIKSDRIVLPLKVLWGDIYYEAFHLALKAYKDKSESFFDNIDYNDIIHTLEASIKFSIQPKLLKCCICLNIQTANQAKYNKLLLVDTKQSEIKKLLDCFFAQGAKGLSLEYKKYFFTMYNSYLVDKY